MKFSKDWKSYEISTKIRIDNSYFGLYKINGNKLGMFNVENQLEIIEIIKDKLNESFGQNQPNVIINDGIYTWLL